MWEEGILVIPHIWRSTENWGNLIIAPQGVISNGMEGAQHSRRNRFVPFLMPWLLVQQFLCFTYCVQNTTL